MALVACVRQGVKAGTDSPGQSVWFLAACRAKNLDKIRTLGAKEKGAKSEMEWRRFDQDWANVLAYRTCMHGTRGTVGSELLEEGAYVLMAAKASLELFKRNRAVLSRFV